MQTESRGGGLRMPHFKRQRFTVISKVSVVFGDVPVRKSALLRVGLTGVQAEAQQVAALIFTTFCSRHSL